MFLENHKQQIPALKYNLICAKMLTSPNELSFLSFCLEEGVQGGTLGIVSCLSET